MNGEMELDKYLVIVSKNEPLTPEKENWFKNNFDYVPYTDEDGQSCMEAETYKAYLKLVEIMKKKYHIDVDSHSAWRSVETQQKVFDELTEEYSLTWAQEHVAKPGTSEHHTGLAFDLRFKPTVVAEALRDQFNEVAKRTGIRKKVFSIMAKEGAALGLILRYQKGKEEVTGVRPEDWHFRYVGVEHAMEMYKSGQCLEEYVKQLKDKNQTKKVGSR